MEFKEYEFGQEQIISELVWDVFEKYEAPEYPAEGVQTFKTFIEPDHLEEMVLHDEYKIYCCFENENIIGVIAFRNQAHISLLFVREDFHRQGIAKALLSYALDDMLKKDMNVKLITVNASPYAQKIYRKMGFSETDKLQQQEGLLFIPMAMKVPHQPEVF